MDAQSPVPPQVEEVFLDELLNVAVQAAKKAGSIIMGNNNADGAQVAATNKANSRDLLTQIDPLCEATIRETILAHFSGHAFLGEEDVPPGKEASTAALENKLATVGDNWLWIVVSMNDSPYQQIDTVQSNHPKSHTLNTHAGSD
jgi:3'-phosphoadenosine 5'-phosphosulfate (PAPS) 3'-phosphatase